MKYLVAIALICVQSGFAQNTKISGKIINHTSDSCSLMQVIPIALGGYMVLGPLASSAVNADGTFTMAFNLDFPTHASFSHGNEGKGMLM